MKTIVQLLLMVVLSSILAISALFAITLRSCVVGYSIGNDICDWIGSYHG